MSIRKLVGLLGLLVGCNTPLVVPPATTDGGSGQDAGIPVDAGPIASSDAGSPTDAGVFTGDDAGPPIDAGTPADAGEPDAGSPEPDIQPRGRLLVAGTFWSFGSNTDGSAVAAETWHQPTGDDDTQPGDLYLGSDSYSGLLERTTRAFAFSPDGRSLAWCAGCDYSPDSSLTNGPLKVLSLEPGATAISLGEMRGDKSFFWMNDSQHLVSWLSAAPAGMAATWLSASGAPGVPIVSSVYPVLPFDESYIVCSRDQHYCYLNTLSDLAGTYSITLWDTVAQTAQTVATGLPQNGWFEVARGEETIPIPEAGYAIAWSDSAGVHSFAPGGEPILLDARPVSEGIVSPDTATAVYVTTDGIVVATRLDGNTAPREFADAAPDTIRLEVLSSYNQWLFYRIVDGTDPSVSSAWVVSTSGLESPRLLTNGIPNGGFTSPDRRWVPLFSDSLALFDTQSGDIVQLGSIGKYGPVFTADSAHALWIDPAQNVNVFDLATSEQRVIGTTDSQYLTTNNITPDSQFVIWHDTSGNVQAYVFATKEQRLLGGPSTAMNPGLGADGTVFGWMDSSRDVHLHTLATGEETLLSTGGATYCSYLGSAVGCVSPAPRYTLTLYPGGVIADHTCGSEAPSGASDTLLYMICGSEKYDGVWKVVP